MGMLDDYIKALQNVPMQEAIPGGAGTTPQGDPTLLSNMLTKTIDLPKKALDAAQHDFTYNVGNPEAPRETVGPAFEIARALMGNGMPFAQKGAAGIFGGRLSKTADLDKLDTAKGLFKNGGLPQEILNKTGWFRNPSDYQWRFEIPDLKSRMIGHGLDYTKDGSFVAGPSQAILQHDELYKAYPELSNYKMYNSVYKNPKNKIGTGEFNNDLLDANPEIAINSNNLTNARSIALHEMQHGVQGIENFSRGGNPNYLAYMREQKPSSIPMRELNSDPEKMYHNLSGEVEARNVQKRADYPQDVRNQIPPWQSMDVPYNNQLSLNPQATLLRALRR
jgi:hypothetical protein